MYTLYKYCIYRQLRYISFFFSLYNNMYMCLHVNTFQYVHTCVPRG